MYVGLHERIYYLFIPNPLNVNYVVLTLNYLYAGINLSINFSRHHLRKLKYIAKLATKSFMVCHSLALAACWAAIYSSCSVQLAAAVLLR